jgi:hypothetical protein
VREPSLFNADIPSVPGIMDTKFVAVNPEHSPPYPASPQQASVPSDFRATKAYLLDLIVTTPLVNLSA